jgi:hypothetical protein
MPINSDPDELQNVSNSFKSQSGFSNLKKLFSSSGNDAMTQAITNKRKAINSQPDDSQENNQGVE